MNFRKYTLCALSLLALVSSCKKDDDPEGPTFISADRTEQQLIDGDSLTFYLETHFYNSAAFATPGDYHISDIIIEELPKDENGNFLPLQDPANTTILADVVETHEVTYLDVNYEYYILRLNQGGGEQPHFCDVLRVNYSGMDQSGDVFDSTVTPVDLALLSANGAGLIEGWKNVLPQFNAATNAETNFDGTASFVDYGLGVMFLPSGLAYFASPPFGLARYSNLVFKFELYQFDVADHDNDGIPSYLEDLNNNKNLFDDDTDADGIPNFLDVDDDGDGVLTLNELLQITYTVDTNMGDTEPVLAAGEYERSRTVFDGVITLKTVKVVDSDANNVPDYLQNSIAVNNNQ